MIFMSSIKVTLMMTEVIMKLMIIMRRRQWKIRRMTTMTCSLELCPQQLE